MKLRGRCVRDVAGSKYYQLHSKILARPSIFVRRDSDVKNMYYYGKELELVVPVTGKQYKDQHRPPVLRCRLLDALSFRGIYYKNILIYFNEYFIFRFVLTDSQRLDVDLDSFDGAEYYRRLYAIYSSISIKTLPA